VVFTQNLQLARTARIISLLVPAGTGYGAASPGDHALHRTMCAEIEGGARGETATRVKLADCGKSPAGELLAGLASALGSAAAAAGGVFVFAERDQAGFSRWAIASQLPAAWPQTTCTGSVPWRSRGHPLPRQPRHRRRSRLRAAAGDRGTPVAGHRPGRVVPGSGSGMGAAIRRQLRSDSVRCGHRGVTQAL